MKSISGTIMYGDSPKFNFATRNEKFLGEKVALENEEYAVCFDGVLLNSVSLFERHNCCDNGEVLVKLYSLYNADMVLQTKGAYALFLWDKKREKVLITNDLLSKRSIYYHISKKGVCFAASYYDLLETLAKTEYTPKLNYTAVKNMSNSGFLSGNETYLEDVFYLNAFESIVIDLQTHTAEIVRHTQKKVFMPENEDDVLDQFDKLFTAAVKLQLEKNKEYGYKQVFAISGGMDSRACLLKALACDCEEHPFAFTYAQSGSLDFKISQQIAVDYRLNYMFYPMDSALFIDHLDVARSRNECMQLSVGSTAAATMADLLNTTNIGIINVGLLGGELMGDLITIKRGRRPQGVLLKTIKAIMEKKERSLSFDYGKLLDHLRACQNFAYMFLHCCEVFSPFMDEDVFGFVSQIDLQKLYSRKLYSKWMIKYQPNPYISTYNCCCVDASPLRIAVTKLYYAVCKRAQGKSKRDMNPFGFWFSTMPEYQAKFIEEKETFGRMFERNENTKKIFEIGQDGWSTDWRKNAAVLTAFHEIAHICQKFQCK